MKCKANIILTASSYSSTESKIIGIDEQFPLIIWQYVANKISQNFANSPLYQPWRIDRSHTGVGLLTKLILSLLVFLIFRDEKNAAYWEIDEWNFSNLNPWSSKRKEYKYL